MVICFNNCNFYYRLPSLLKTPTITVPSLYNGVMIEKDLPSVLNIMEKIEPVGPQQAVETPATQVTQKKLDISQTTHTLRAAFTVIWY